MEEVQFCVKHPTSGRCLHVAGLQKAEHLAQELADKFGCPVFYDVVDFHFRNGGTPVYPINATGIPTTVTLSVGDWMHVMDWYSRLVKSGAVLQEDAMVFDQLMNQITQPKIYH